MPVEPPVEPVPELLRAYRAREPWLEGRLVITPHSAFRTPEAWEDIRRKSAETMARRAGQPAAERHRAGQLLGRRAPASRDGRAGCGGTGFAVAPSRACRTRFPMTTTANHRTADHPIDPLFLERWSPRAFTRSRSPRPS